MNGKRQPAIDWLYKNIVNRLRTLPERPDFTQANIELATYQQRNEEGKVVDVAHAIFTDHPPDISSQNEWVTSYMDYVRMADHEFSRRYPEHAFSVELKKNEGGFSHDYIYIWAKVGMHNTQKAKRLLEELIADHPEEYPEYFKIRENPQEYDELYDKAVEIVKKYKQTSAKILIKKLKITYARAARLLDIMESAGIIGPADRKKARKVL